MAMTSCTKCGGTEIDKGWLMSAGKIAYKSDKFRFQFSSGNVRSYVCMSCGYVESFVSSEYLDRVKSKSD